MSYHIRLFSTNFRTNSKMRQKTKRAFTSSGSVIENNSALENKSLYSIWRRRDYFIAGGISISRSLKSTNWGCKNQNYALRTAGAAKGGEWLFELWKPVLEYYISASWSTQRLFSTLDNRDCEKVEEFESTNEEYNVRLHPCAPDNGTKAESWYWRCVREKTLKGNN